MGNRWAPPPTPRAGWGGQAFWPEIKAIQEEMFEIFVIIFWWNQTSPLICWLVG